MADYTRIAGLAVGEAFDGAQATAEALVVAYPDVISIYQNESEYPYPEGQVAVDPAETGVTTAISTSKASDDDPLIIEIEVTAEATASGDLTIEFLEEEPIVVAVLDTDDTPAKVATKIAAATFPGYTATVDTATVTLTQDSDPQGDAILLVIDHMGQTLNAYKDNYIVWETIIKNFVETETITVWGKTDFEKWFVAVV